MQYLSAEKVGELTGYSKSALMTWARTGQIPARKEAGYWYVQWPLPADFKPRSRPYSRIKAQVIEVPDPTAAPPPVEAPPVEAPASPAYTDQDVARVLMEIIGDVAGGNRLELLQLTLDRLVMQSIDQVAVLERIADHLELQDHWFQQIVAQQQRLADAWEKPTPPQNGVLDRMLGRH